MQKMIPVAVTIHYKKVELWPLTTEESVYLLFMVCSCLAFMLGFAAGRV